jgi:peptide/nickel transport system substrate-binding protein
LRCWSRLYTPETASAQKPGGVLQVGHRDSPASTSTLEEVTISTVAPMMAVFNNLVIFDQHVPQNTLQSIVPDLATGWSWNEDGTELTFRLREGVRWHDRQPFTAKDVQCTWDMLLGRSAAKFRINPRKSWYWNLDRVTVDGDHQATFHLSQPRPALIALLASGYSPVYPCHVPPQEMRQHPIGTGPFKFVSYKPGESIPPDSQSGLLESGPALSRRHRMDDHPQPLDGSAGFRRGKARYDLSLRGDRATIEGHRA